MIGITGYSGFIGRNLLGSLNASDVVLIGRKKLEGFGNFIKFDLAEKTIVHDSLQVNRIETIVHIAARVHVMTEKNNDGLNEFRALNTEGTLSLAKQAAQSGVKRFIFISTIKVNGESTTDRKPYTAFDTPNPIDSYGISKLEAEQGLQEIGSISGMEIVIIRPPLVYGYGVKANFASLMSLVSKGFPLPFRALNSNKRSLVSVYNLVDLIKHCIAHPNAANQVFLVSDGNDLSTAEMVALMAKVQNRRDYSLPMPYFCFRIIGKVLSSDGVVDRLTGSLQLDISHTRLTLDWSPPYSTEHGFKLAAKK